MKTVEESLRLVLDFARPLGVEQVPLTDSLYRVLAYDTYSPRHVPPLDNSAMDGYALRWIDISTASKDHPVTLHCIEKIAAGTSPEQPLRNGETSRIMTGAPVPAGADAVVKIEDVSVRKNRVTFFAPAGDGDNIRRRGEDIRQGELAAAQGTPVNAARMGMLAATGHAQVPVYRRPLVAVIATGDELVDVTDTPGENSIISSNSYSLFGQIVEAGGIPVPLGISRDTKKDLLDHFTRALDRADVVISSGGVSVGDYDYVHDVLKELGARIEIDTVAQRPGKPFTFAALGDTPFFGLPGNPVSAMMSFEQYVRPALRKMTGHTALYRKTATAVLEENITKRIGLTYFIRGVLTFREGRFTVTTTGDQGSGILKSMVRANTVIVMPRHLTHIARGDRVTIQLIDDSLLSAATPDYLDPA